MEYQDEKETLMPEPADEPTAPDAPSQEDEAGDGSGVENTQEAQDEAMRVPA